MGRIIARVFFALLAICALTGSVITYNTSLAKFFATFTYISNLLAVVFIIGNLLGIIKNRIYIFTCTYTTITMTVYHILLSKGITNENWTSIILHYIFPLFIICDFTFLEPMGKIKISNIWKTIIFPIFYFVYTVSYGLITDKYSYFFLNVNEVGVQGIIKWFIILSMTFLLVALILAAIKNFIINNKRMSEA